ncbi:amidohydrolase family protein [Schnuerera sp.]|uniref:amidohydrolase family protein n=1 Tax=Schnuerera sp. TaxID=2794844 RepID=UPI002B67F8F5|nr:amidohydrolase family protein [Schnuerera sp.]HSH35536.1 amidohydrolase family protein [Schnuerera sp.]
MDAQDLIVTPGFIDIHSHSDDSFIKDNRLESKIYQGVTTEIVGQCGYSYYQNDGNRKRTLTEFIENVNEKNKKTSINWATLVGHNSLRSTKATYKNPFQKPVGIEYVIVNGKVVIKEGQQTDNRSGEFLLKHSRI